MRRRESVEEQGEAELVVGPLSARPFDLQADAGGAVDFREAPLLGLPVAPTEASEEAEVIGEFLRGEATTAELCRKHQLSDSVIADGKSNS